MKSTTDTSNIESYAEDISMTIIPAIVVVLCVYAVGVYFHIKIIKVSLKDKDITWKMDITNSCMLLFHGMHDIFMHSITYLIQDLYTYTGEWFCYTSKVLVNYGNMYMFGHSLVLSIMKYILIVKWQTTREFGKEKLIKIFFWINIMHPLFRILFQLIISPDYFWEYDGYPQFDRCLGDPKDNLAPNNNKSLTKLHDLCGLIVEPPRVNYLQYTVYICRLSCCWLNVVFIYLVVWNLIEILFYCQTFAFMRR